MASALEEALDNFLLTKRQQGVSARTLKVYRWNLRRLLDWLERRDVISPEQITRKRLLQWGAGLWDGWAPATVRLAITIALAFLSWMEAEDLCPSGLRKALKRPVAPRRAQRTLSSEEILLLLNAANIYSRYGRRARAIVLTLIDTGLRAAELCALALDGLDLDDREMTIRYKGGHEGKAFFGETTERALRSWLQDRELIAKPDEKAVFVSIAGNKPGTHLSPRGLAFIVQGLGESVGLKDVSPHCFRRSFACLTTEAGAPARWIMKAGRWHSIDEVLKYTQALEVKKQRDDYLPVDRLLEF